MNFPPLLIAWLVLLAVLLIGHLWRSRPRYDITLTFLLFGKRR